MNPNNPVYIISKGRYHRRPLANYFESIGLEYNIVVEESEYEEYKKVVKGNVLILPQHYKDDYDRFWDDDDPRHGAGAPRNYCWDHSIENGFSHHWVFDDNIEFIARFNKNMKVRCNTPTPLYVVEQWVDRYENIAIAGLGYTFFCPAYEARVPIRLNTRIYSSLYIRNDIPYRWRGRYNEDTDLSLRAMKDGWVTAEFNAFLSEKRATQSVRGGNSAEFYDEEGTYAKSKMLVDMHPDVTRMEKRWDRWHHYVNYEPFKKNQLIKKPGLEFSGNNEFGMKLVKL